MCHVRMYGTKLGGGTSLIGERAVKEGETIGYNEKIWPEVQSSNFLSVPASGIKDSVIGGGEVRKDSVQTSATLFLPSTVLHEF